MSDDTAALLAQIEDLKAQNDYLTELCDGVAGGLTFQYPMGEGGHTDDFASEHMAKWSKSVITGSPYATGVGWVMEAVKEVEKKCYRRFKRYEQPDPPQDP